MDNVSKTIRKVTEGGEFRVSRLCFPNVKDFLNICIPKQQNCLAFKISANAALFLGRDCKDFNLQGNFLPKKQMNSHVRNNLLIIDFCFSRLGFSKCWQALHQTPNDLEDYIEDFQELLAILIRLSY